MTMISNESYNIVTFSKIVGSVNRTDNLIHGRIDATKCERTSTRETEFLIVDGYETYVSKEMTA